MRAFILGLAVALVVAFVVSMLNRRRRMRHPGARPKASTGPRESNMRSTLRLVWWVTVAVMAMVTIASWVRFFYIEGR